MINKLDMASLIICELKNNYPKLTEERIFMEINKSLCNGVLYNDPKFKESTIILTHVFKNLMTDFVKEVTLRINKEGDYKDEQL